MTTSRPRSLGAVGPTVLVDLEPESLRQGIPQVLDLPLLDLHNTFPAALAEPRPVALAPGLSDRLQRGLVRKPKVRPPAVKGVERAKRRFCAGSVNCYRPSHNPGFATCRAGAGGATRTPPSGIPSPHELAFEDMARTFLGDELDEGGGRKNDVTPEPGP